MLQLSMQEVKWLRTYLKSIATLAIIVFLVCVAYMLTMCMQTENMFMAVLISACIVSAVVVLICAVTTWKWFKFKRNK